MWSKFLDLHLTVEGIYWKKISMGKVTQLQIKPMWWYTGKDNCKLLYTIFKGTVHNWSLRLSGYGHNPFTIKINDSSLDIDFYSHLLHLMYLEVSFCSPLLVSVFLIKLTLFQCWASYFLKVTKLQLLARKSNLVTVTVTIASVTVTVTSI